MLSTEFEMDESMDVNSTDPNGTMPFFGNSSMNDDYIFDRMDVNIIFFTLYSIVFVCCFFGNLIVILVVTFSRQLGSITNFFLANLAAADLCVGIFCVFQTLTNYLMASWPLGDLLCKAYMFVNAFSYGASILILVLVCTERYLAIVHPIKCRSMRTRGRLRAIVGVVWILAAINAAPKFFYVETMAHKLNSGNVDIMCIANIKKHNKNTLAMVNIILLYFLPLMLMSCLYAKIGVRLWKSGEAFGRPGVVARTRHGRVRHIQTSSRNALRARRGVIRMLIVVVIMFAVCNFPQQARLIWLLWDPNYDSNSDFSTIFTLSTFLISYMNSCLNPLLYAFMSRNFRKGMRELLNCNTRGRGRGLGMACAGGDGTRNENGHNTIVPQSSVVRLSSAHDSPCTTYTISRQNTLGRTS